MPKDPKKYLYDISESIKIIFEEYLSDIHSLEEYDESLMIQDAVERRIFIIAEALSRLRKLDINLPSGDQIINRRNTIAHQYDEYNSRKIWLSIHKELPKLKTEVDKLLAQ